MSKRWAVKWHVGWMWNGVAPHLFRTRKEAKIYIDDHYGYIRAREDLRRPPHNWRLPKAVKVEVILKEVRKYGR